MGERPNEINPYDENRGNLNDSDQVRFVGFNSTGDDLQASSADTGSSYNPNDYAIQSSQTEISVDNSSGEPQVEVIRTDISQTRAAMSDTIDAIQQKLNPQQIMDQAKTTIKDTATELMDHAKDSAVEAVDHAKEAAVEAVDHTKQTVHDATVGKVEHMVDNLTGKGQDNNSGIIGTITSNPLPAALVSIGLGMMFMKSRKNKSSSTTTSGGYGYMQRSTNYPNPTNPPYGYPSSVNSIYGYPSLSTNPYSGVSASPSDMGTNTASSDNSEGIVNKIIETVQENPIPAALTGLGIGYLVMQSQNSGKQNNNNYSYSQYTEQGSGVGQKVSNIAQQTGDLAGQAGSKVGDAAGTVAQGVGNVAGGVASGVGTVASGVASGVGTVAGGVASGVGTVVGGTGDAIGNIASGVGEQAQRAETQFGRMLEEKPLAVGAIALAIGITVGLMLPNTPEENQLMGAVHDDFMEKVQETTQQTFEKVQNVTAQVSSTAKNAMQDISSTAAQEAKNQGLTQ